MPLLNDERKTTPPVDWVDQEGSDRGSNRTLSIFTAMLLFGTSNPMGLFVEGSTATPQLQMVAVERAPANQLTPLELPGEFVEAVNALHRLPDWDDEGAGAINEEACETALELVGALIQRNPDAPLPWPAASILGAVSLYWNGDGRHLIVRVFGADPTQVFYQIEGPLNHREHGTESFQNVLGRAVDFFAA